MSDLRLRLAVFDCDGTLVDSQHHIVDATNAAWTLHGLVPPPAEAVRRLVGLPLIEAIAALLPDAESDHHHAVMAAFKAHFSRQRTTPDWVEPLFPGAADALDALDAAGVLLGVATGKSRRGLVATLEQHGLTNRFVTLQTADDCPGKPRPDMLLRAMAEAGTDPGETVMIGDTTYDVLMARNAGVPAIGVAWGYHEASELEAAGAAVVVSSFADLPAALDRLAGPTRTFGRIA